jgi:hypothetical protein
LPTFKPNKKQAIALSLRKVKELFYGGSRGGGKSWFILADFLNGADQWGEYWNGILFRQTYSQLDDLFRQARQLYFPFGAEERKSESLFTFPNGANIKFRYLEHDDDVYDYQGHNYTWIGFDELGNYRTSYPWEYMLMCLRSTSVPEEWLRIRGTGNPGGYGHTWLKKRFIEGYEPYKVYRHQIGIDGHGRDMYISRAFVPATVDDNEILMKNNPQYKAFLMAQPERIRQAMLEGRWDIKSGGEYFSDFDERVHVCRPFLMGDGWYRFYALDWGYKSPYAVVKLAVNKDGMMVVYGELYGQGVVDGVEKENTGSQTPSTEVAKTVAEHMAEEGVTECVADYSIWENKGGTGTVVESFFNEGIGMIKAYKHHRESRFQKMHDLLNLKDEFGNPYLRIFQTCKYTIREIENIQCDKNKPETPDSRQPDHAIDALSYGIVSELYEYNQDKPDVGYSESNKTLEYKFNPFEKGSYYSPNTREGRY